jgi:hypothetical protein
VAVRSGNKKTVATRTGTVLPRNRALGPRNTGILWDLLGPDVETRALTIKVDTSLRVAGLLNRDTDGQLLVSAARETSADSRIAVSGVVEKNSDAAVRVSARLASERDAMLRIFGRTSRSSDARLAVANTVESLTDFLVRVAGFRQVEPDTSLVVIGLLDRSADVYLEITDAGLVRADTQLVVTRPVFFAAGEGLLVLQRLVPDLATHQTVYAVLIRESHSIQV